MAPSIHAARVDFRPVDDYDMAYSLALTDHYFALETLRDIGGAIPEHAGRACHQSKRSKCLRPFATRVSSASLGSAAQARRQRGRTRQQRRSPPSLRGCSVDGPKRSIFVFLTSLSCGWDGIGRGNHRTRTLQAGGAGAARSWAMPWRWGGPPRGGGRYARARRSAGRGSRDCAPGGRSSTCRRSARQPAATRTAFPMAGIFSDDRLHCGHKRPRSVGRFVGRPQRKCGHDRRTCPGARRSMARPPGNGRYAKPIR